jgi:uncharacterized protein YicC (UPF0701 family)
MIDRNVRRTLSQRFLLPALIVVLALGVLAPTRAAAESQGQTTDHIVSAQALQQSVQKQAETRQKNIATVQGMFKTPLAQRAMKMEHVNPVQIQKAIPTLSNSELANLSARATSAQQDFAAGRLDNQTLLLIIIAMLFIIILVAIH